MRGAREQLQHADWLRSSGVSGPTAIGWAITALFYATVHALRGYVAERHRHRVASHEDVRRLWNKYPELKRVKANYTGLKQQSESARYYLNDQFTWNDYDKLRSKAEAVVKFFENKMDGS